MSASDEIVKVTEVEIAKMPGAAWHELELRRAFLNKLSSHVEFMLPDGALFSLVIWSGEDPSLEGTFTSNAQRESMIKGIEEFLEKFKAGEVWDHYQSEGQA